MHAKAKLLETKISNGKKRSLREVVRPTNFIEAPRLSKRLGIDITIASETFQHTGSFKFRAAYNLALKVPHTEIIAASSGNFGQALAFACQLLGKSCTIVMPDNSVKVKVEAIREYGGHVDLIDTSVITREVRVSELAGGRAEVYTANAYDDLLIIEGNGSLGEELVESGRTFDCVVIPIGGGGLSSGVINAFKKHGHATGVVGAEPLIANDAARSLKAGHIIANETEPQTIADGTRTLSVGVHNWAILKDGLSEIIEVREEQIVEGVRLLFSMANLKAEPTGALPVAALLAAPEKFQGKSVCCVVTGGNVDPETYSMLLS